MRRAQRLSLILIVALTVASLLAVVLSGTSPKLGLDLQGGASVVLEPNRDVDNDVLDQSIEIIRSRVDALGVAEPDISRQGDSIVVQLPGIEDQERALRIVGQTAELRFRPVLNILPGDDTETTTTTAGATTTSAAPTSTTAADTTAPEGATTTPEGATTTTAVVTSTTSVTDDDGPPVTPREQDTPDATVVLPQLDDDGRQVVKYILGPATLTGRAVSDAQAQFPQGGVGEWLVSFDLTSEGSGGFDALAAQCFGKEPTCPTGQLAIVLDSVVRSAPAIQEPSFGGSGQITGGFTEREAKDLALVLRFGSLPVQLEPQAVQRVSATLGKDSLRAGIIAGLGGLVLVFLYMILYYRALGIVVILGLGASGALMYSFVAWLGETSGLALTLAGAVGIVVSVGVTVDSYVVYFERLKDDVRAGKTVRSSVDRSFKAAWRTILAGNMSSLIGAALLYFLTVGPVRGFAFFLAVSTVIDILMAYFFTWPMVIMLGRNRTFTENRYLGVARGLAVRPSGSA